MKTQNRSGKIIWFLFGNPVFTASSRIHGLAVHRQLVKLGFNSYIAYLPEFIEEEIPFDFARKKHFETLVSAGDKIVLQKIKSPVNLHVLRYFKELGLKLILIDCDWPPTKEVGEMVDLIICTSKVLRDKYVSLNLNAVFIEDCPEVYFDQAKKPRKEKLECIWFGDGSYKRWDDVTWLKQLFHEKLPNWKLVTISNHSQADIRWTQGCLQVLKRADACAIPIRALNDESKAKSANRLLQSMALSVPVVCSPLPSYVDIVTKGKDAIISSSDEEWIEAFQKLEDEVFRIQMGENAFKSVKNFSIDQTINLWIKALSLDEEFKSDDAQKSSTQNRFSDFFYQKLVMRNPNYAKKMSLSVRNLFLLVCSVALKLKNRIKKLAGE